MNEQDQNEQQTDASAGTSTDTPTPAEAPAETEVSQTSTDSPVQDSATDVAAAAPDADTEKAAHPAHRVLNELENSINALGSYAVSTLMNLVNEVRSLL